MIAREKLDYILQRFDRLSNYYRYNPFTRWVGASELGAMRDLLSPPERRGETPALDFGCGTGRVTKLLLAAGYNVTGYDISPGMVEQARAAIGKRKNVRFTSDPESVNGPWALIAALGVLDYYPDSAELWREWRRLIQPGGTLLVTAPNAHSPLARIYTALSRFTCQAYATTFEKLADSAWMAGFTPLEVRFAFPRRWWGHTVVMALRAD
jgi:SAM-dependent methyltransferase